MVEQLTWTKDQLGIWWLNQIQTHNEFNSYTFNDMKLYVTKLFVFKLLM